MADQRPEVTEEEGARATGLYLTGALALARSVFLDDETSDREFDSTLHDAAFGADAYVRMINRLPTGEQPAGWPKTVDLRHQVVRAVLRDMGHSNLPPGSQDWIEDAAEKILDALNHLEPADA